MTDILASTPLLWGRIIASTEQGKSNVRREGMNPAEGLIIVEAMLVYYSSKGWNMWPINDYAIWGSFLESNLTQKKGTEVNWTQQLSLFSLELGSNMLKWGHRSLGLRARVHGLRKTSLTHNRDKDWLTLLGHMLTLLEDFAKVLVLAGTVPASKAELVLAFAHTQLGALCNFVDDLRLGLAQFGLLACQTFGLPADAVWVHDQGTPHCPETNKASSDDSSELHKVSQDKVRLSSQTTRHTNHFKWWTAL